MNFSKVCLYHRYFKLWMLRDNLSLKYQRLTVALSGCTDKRIRKLEFVAKIPSIKVVGYKTSIFLDKNRK